MEPTKANLSDPSDADKSSSSIFSEEQYRTDNIQTDRAGSATPKITAISSLQEAMSNMIETKQHKLDISFAECDVVRAAIHYLGDLFCEFNDTTSSISKNSKTSKNSSNLSYKEHENESIEANKFVKFLEDKFSLYGYSTKEINQLFIDLKPQTPLPFNNNSTKTIHFTEFNVVIHQFYTTKFKSIFADKSTYQKEDIYQLLLHSIKAKLQGVRHKLSNINKSSVHLDSPIGYNEEEEVSSPINMEHLLVKHKIEQEQLRQRMQKEQDSISYNDDEYDDTNKENDDTKQNNPFLNKPPSSNNLQHSISDISPIHSIHNRSRSPIFNDIEISVEASHDMINIFESMPSFKDSHIMNQSDLESLIHSNHTEQNKEDEEDEEEEEEETYEEEDDDDEDDEDDYDINDVMKQIEDEIHDQMSIGAHISFGESGLIIQCNDGKPEHDIYEFNIPHTLCQDLGINDNKHNKLTFNHLYKHHQTDRLSSTRSNQTDITSDIFSSTSGCASPLSLLSSKPATIRSNIGQSMIENPFEAVEPINDSVYQRQEYKYHYQQFFTGNVYLTTQQLRFVNIDPILPDFMKEEHQKPLYINCNHDNYDEDDYKMTPRSITPRTPNTNAISSNHHNRNKKRNRSHNLRQIAQINTETQDVPMEGDKNVKVNENKDLYDEDKKLAAILQSLSTMNYEFVPNGLLTHLQFIEFIDILQIYNYEKHVLKHMFRYIYTEELPPTLPPPPIIEFDHDEEDNYNNVNGMYVAYSECIGYEYDEILDLIEPYKYKKQSMRKNLDQSFDDLLTTMVVERLQTIYQTLKFDDLDAHPNQFLYRQQSFEQKQEDNKLNGDELKENVFNYFDERRDIKKENESDVHNRMTLLLNNNYASNTNVSTMRSTQSETLTYNNSMFRQSIISHDSLMIANVLNNNNNNNNKSPKPDKLNKDKSVTPKLVNATSISTTTLTHHPQNAGVRTPITPITIRTQQTQQTQIDAGSVTPITQITTNTNNNDMFEKYPALIDIHDIPQQYHHKIQSLQSRLMKKQTSLNIPFEDTDIDDMDESNMDESNMDNDDIHNQETDGQNSMAMQSSVTNTTNTIPPQLQPSPSITNITGITNVANVTNFTPKEGSDDDHNIITHDDDDDDDDIKDNHNLLHQPPAFVASSSNDSMSSVDLQISSPHNKSGKRKKNHSGKRGHSASRQPSLPTLPEERIDSNHNNPNTDHGHLRQQISSSLLNDIDDKVDQLFATIGSDQVHIDLLKYGLRLIEISLNPENEHYFLQILQSYGHDNNNTLKIGLFVHKDWIKQFLYDRNIPNDLQSLQDKIVRNLKRKSHLLINSELSHRRSSYGTNSSYPLSDDTFTNRATHNATSRHLNGSNDSSLSTSTYSSQHTSSIYNEMPRELQQTYVRYFKQTLKSRTKALSQYTQTRYSPIHKKYWRDIFLFMSEGKPHLNRGKFKQGIERCGIKIRTDKKSSTSHRDRKQNKKHKDKEIEQILNAVFVEMDVDNTGYITVHAFTLMMMCDDQDIASNDSSSYYSNKHQEINTAQQHLYNTYSSYGYSETGTHPRKSYEHLATTTNDMMTGHKNMAYNYHHHQKGYNKNSYLQPHHHREKRQKKQKKQQQQQQHYTSSYNPHSSNLYSYPSSNDREKFLKSKKKQNKRYKKEKEKQKQKQKKRHHKNNSGKYDKYEATNHQFVEREYSLSSNEEQQIYYEDVEEKTHNIHENENDEMYLNNAWNSIQTRDGTGYIEEEQDEKIPMLDVVNTHMKNMKNLEKNNNNNKSKKNKSKNKNKSRKNSRKKKSKTSLYNTLFIVSRKRLNGLDFVERRYYITIDRESEKVILSPSNEVLSEVTCEFGLHQIIIGDHQSTLIQIKTINGRHIYYEFDVRQSKDEFVDLLDEVKHESNNRNNAMSIDTELLLPRGCGFPDCLNIGQVEEDIDPNFYEDECSICRATLCTQSTLYWFLFLSIIHIIAIYIYIKYLEQMDNFNIIQNSLLIWILFNMIILRLSAIKLIGKHLILICIKIFDCIWCHRFIYYGFSASSLITIWTIFWLGWDVIIIGEQIWNTKTNTPLQVISFGFIVLSLTFLLFAQFAYCRCRCCSKTVSELLHTVLARLACCFMAIYGILYCISSTTPSTTIDIIYYASFWLSLILIIDFIFYFIYICILNKNQLKINGMDIELRVMSDEQCEVHIPFNIDPFSYIWISDDRATWIKLPILASITNKNKHKTIIKKKKYKKMKKGKGSKMNVEENPYHRPSNSSADLELQTMTEIHSNNNKKHHHHHKLKNTLSRSSRNSRNSRSRNKYEAVGQGLTYDRDRTGFVVGSMDDSLDGEQNNNNNNNNMSQQSQSKCSIIIHARNKMGKRMIENASYCFEEATFPIYIKKYDTPLTIMCFAFVYKAIGIIATDDRIIPAISYILYMNNNYKNKQHIDVLWLVNKPSKQYYNLYQMLLLNKNKNIKIVDMTKKKTSKEKQIGNFLDNISSQAIFALTSRHQGLRIKKQSKHAVVYIQHTEWY